MGSRILRWMTVKRKSRPRAISPTERKFRSIKRKGFPACQGTFPDCPEEIEPDSPPKTCRICPYFK